MDLLPQKKIKSFPQHFGILLDSAEEPARFRAFGDDFFREVSVAEIYKGDEVPDALAWETARQIANSFPRLKSLHITLERPDMDVFGKALSELKMLCETHGAGLSIGIALPDTDNAHTVELMQKASEMQERPLLECAVSSDNVYSVGFVRHAAAAGGLECAFRLKSDVAIDALNLAERSFLADFLVDTRTLMSAKSPGSRLSYLELSRRLGEGGTRKTPCPYQTGGVFVDAQGMLAHCPYASAPFAGGEVSGYHAAFASERAVRILNETISGTCPTCTHYAKGSLSRFQSIRGSSIGMLARRVQWAGRIALRFFCKGPFLLLRARQFRPRDLWTSERESQGHASLDSPLLLSTYGVEHVGDAAIMGGVLGRLSRQFGITKAVLASFRPHRTRRWAQSLHTDVSCRVIPYEKREVRRALEKAGCLVFSGGPFMDMPNILPRHLDAALHARRLGLPVFVEGVGIGQLHMSLSQAMIKRIFELSSRIALRTGYSRRLVNGWGIDAVQTPEPACDYIAEMKKYIASETYDPPDSLKKVLKGDGPIVAINVRPFWVKPVKRSYLRVMSRERDERFLEMFAQALNTVNCSGVRYICFPMNADQYGCSDLETGYRLQDKLRRDVDFRIWEYEPNVEDVLYLLRASSACVAMRFHACTFALEMGVSTIGIDYESDRAGKVTNLFEDRDMEESVIHAAVFRPEWLRSRLEAYMSG